MGATSSQTEEECGQDTNHSAMTLPVERQTPEQLQDQVFEEAPEEVITTRNHRELESDGNKSAEVKLESKESINWPPVSQKEVWKKLDEDLEDIFRTTLKGSVEAKLESMAKIIYRISLDRFGIQEKGGKRKEGTSGSSRRQNQISLLRKELRLLARQ